MAISTITYPRVQSWYNSERRQQTGNMEYIKDENEYTQFNQMQEFHLNASGTTEQNPNTVTLFTFANGVTIEYEYYLSGQSETAVGIDGYLRYKNKDGVEFHTERINMASDLDYASASNFPMFFNPTCTTYEQTPAPGYGDSADRVYYADIYYIKDNMPPNKTLPDLDGDLRKFDYYLQPGWTQYYTRGSTNWMFTDQEYNEFIDALNMAGDGTPITPLLPADDTSEPGGGEEEHPDYNPYSDDIEFPELPSGGAIESGMVKVYAPTSGQLRGLAQKLWSRDFVETILKVLNDPMEAIVSLHTLPIGLAGTSTNCVIGNYDTGIAMPAISHQYMSVNMGSIYVPEHWGSALDYNPYVTIDIFLPFIGIQHLLVDDIIGRTLEVRYNIDVVTGSAVAMIKSGGSVLYAYNTCLSGDIPITMSSFGPLMQSIKGAIGNVIMAGATGGIGGAVGGALGSAINVATSKASTISRGSALGASHGFLSEYRPYLIIHRPIQSLASGFAHFKGYPSNITGTIDSVSGYTEVESVHLTGIPCTDIERDEINALLYNGVIV